MKSLIADSKKYVVKVTLSGGSVRYIMHRGRRSQLFMNQAKIFLSFIDSHGYGFYDNRLELFGDLEYLKSLHCAEIRTIRKIDFLEINQSID